MKVCELIEKLKSFDQELDVVVKTNRGLSHIEEPRDEYQSRKLVLIAPE